MVTKVFFLFFLHMGLTGSLRAEHSPQTIQKRRPLASRIARWVKGTDISVKYSSFVGACQSTPVAKKTLSETGLCRLAYVTAAHCVLDDSNRFFNSIEIAGVGEIPSTKIQKEVPREYFKKTSGDPRAPRRGDTATLIFDISCEKAKNVIPVELAPVQRDGTTRIDSAHVYLQKRESAAPGNRGGGVQIVADVAEPENSAQFRFVVPSPQGYAIVGGDSGGPVFNENGQLVCPISGSSFEYLRSTGGLTRPRTGDNTRLDPFTVVCDNRAVARLKDQLERFGLMEG